MSNVQYLQDAGRLASLRRTARLDSQLKEAFDRLTRLATKVLHAPVALVTLVDVDRQFFMSCIGLPEPWASLRETPLSHSICQHTVTSGKPLIITDARADPLVRHNLAIPDLGVVAYAGIPLITSDGHTLGSFCVIDHKARSWTDSEVSILTDLTASAITEIELRAAGVEKLRLLRESQRAHLSVARERARLREIFTQAPSLIALLVGPEHTFEFANPTYQHVLGHQEAALIGRTVREALPELAGQGFYELLDMVYRSGVPYVAAEAPMSLGRRNGDIPDDTYISFIYQPMRDSVGSVAGIVVQGVDVTEQVHARQRLQLEHDRLQQVLDVLPEAVAIADMRGCVVMANLVARDLLGENIVGQSLARAEQASTADGLCRLDGSPYPAEELPLERSLRRGEEVRGVQALLSHPTEDRKVSVLMNSVPLHDAAGDINGAVIVFQDITTIKTFEHARDELLATVTHDLKNPLTAIQGLAELTQAQAARSGTPSSTQVVTRQAGIVTAATQMTGLLNEVFDVLQLQMGQQLTLDRRQVNLVGLVQHVVDYQREVTSQHIDMESDGTDVICTVDKDRLERVVSNLISNAVKYSPREGQVVVHLTRTSGSQGNWAVLEVADQGRGIPPVDLPHVFEHFYRASNVEDVQGTGIGLASVRQIVEQHAGTVTIASQEGVGTTVSVRLPLADTSSS